MTEQEGDNVTRLGAERLRRDSRAAVTAAEMLRMIADDLDRGDITAHGMIIGILDRGEDGLGYGTARYSWALTAEGSIALLETMKLRTFRAMESGE